MRHRSGTHRRDTRLVRLAPAHTPPPQARNTIYNIWPEKRHQCCRCRLRASLMPERRHNLPTIHHGDCIQVMNAMPANSIDAIVTDPPYGLGFMGRKWDGLPPSLDWAEACYRVLKPGAPTSAFGGTTPSHGYTAADSPSRTTWARPSTRPQGQNEKSSASPRPSPRVVEKVHPGSRHCVISAGVMSTTHGRTRQAKPAPISRPRAQRE